MVFELGEYYQGDVRKLCEFVKPQIGFITGINEAHLKKFKTIDKTIDTIFELVDYIGDGLIYVNGENELALNRSNDRQNDRQIIYDRKHVGDIIVKNIKSDLSGTTFTIFKNKSTNITGDGINLKSNLLGLHQIGPIISAIDLAFKLGLTVEQVVEGVSKTKPFDHRLEPKVDSSGVITLDDSYNGNPDGVKAVIEFLGSLTSHRRFYVTPGLVEMGSKTKEVHIQIGRQLAQAKIEKIILIKNSVTMYIEEGLISSKYGGEIIWFDDAITAFNSLQNLTVKGDVVLLQNDWPDQYI